MAEHGSLGSALTTLIVVLVALGAVTGYVLAARRPSGRRPWPPARTVCWLTGTAAVVTGSLGPVAALALEDFRAHAVGHVLVGMLGPLLLVLGAPVTLALRTLPVASARRLTAVLRSAPLRLLTQPAVAVLLDLGGLWLLYRTPLLGWTHDQPAVHLMVHLHLVLSGYLLAAVLVGPDPLPHRRSHRHRAVALVAAMALHAILAKSLYAAPPAAIEPATTQAGAMVMYYAGDAVELALAGILCRSWFARPTARRPLPRRALRAG